MVLGKEKERTDCVGRNIELAHYQGNAEEICLRKVVEIMKAAQASLLEGPMVAGEVVVNTPVSLLSISPSFIREAAPCAFD